MMQNVIVACINIHSLFAILLKKNPAIFVFLWVRLFQSSPEKKNVEGA